MGGVDGGRTTKFENQVKAGIGGLLMTGDLGQRFSFSLEQEAVDAP